MVGRSACKTPSLTNPGEATFSPIYETQPVNCSLEANNFLNAAANLPLSLSPKDALNLCMRIESTFDQVRRYWS